MDIHSRAREKKTDLRDEILPKAIGHFVQWAISQMRRFAEEFHAAIRENDELLTLVGKRKLKWFWPRFKVFWFSKDDSTGHSERKEKRGRQKNRWEENSKEWTGMDFDSSTRQLKTDKMENVAKSSVVPKRTCKVMGCDRIGTQS